MALAKQDCGEQCHPGQRRPANLLKAGKEEVATDLKNRPGVVQMAARDVMTAKVCAPFSVLPNVMAPLPVLVNAVAAPKVAASL